MHERGSQISEPSVISKGRLHLRGEFARRLEYQTSETAVLRQQCENRQSERRSLARPGLRSADQIFSGENNRKPAELDRRWFDKPHRLSSAHNLKRKSEMIK